MSAKKVGASTVRSNGSWGRGEELHKSLGAIGASKLFDAPAFIRPDACGGDKGSREGKQSGLGGFEEEGSEGEGNVVTMDAVW